MLDKWLIALVSPLGTSLVLGLFASLWALGRCKRAAVLTGLLAWVWLLVWSLPVSSDALYRWVTQDYPAQSLAEVPSADVIVLLGGGINPSDRLNPNADLNQAADRMVVAAQLFHLGKASHIILSGGSESTYLTSEAQAMADLLVLLGVPRAALIFEDRSTNTRSNAQLTAPILANIGAKQILLVTSALHLPRAIADFNVPGIRVIPVAADFEARARPTWRAWIPDSRALDISARTFKELAASTAQHSARWIKGLLGL